MKETEQLAAEIRRALELIPEGELLEELAATNHVAPLTGEVGTMEITLTTRTLGSHRGYILAAEGLLHVSEIPLGPFGR